MKLEQTEAGEVRIYWRSLYWPFRVRTCQYFKSGFFWRRNDTGRYASDFLKERLDDNERAFRHIERRKQRGSE